MDFETTERRETTKAKECDGTPDAFERHGHAEKYETSTQAPRQGRGIS